MAIIYACSMDHYGSGTTESVNNSTFGNSSWEWPLEDILPFMGDGWAATPNYFTNNLSFTGHGTLGISKPSWGARQGDFALVAESLRARKNGASGNTNYVSSSSDSVRFNIPGDSQSVRLIHFAFSISELPSRDKIQGHICRFMDPGGATRATLAVSPTGRLQLLTGETTVSQSIGSPSITTPTSILVSSAPVISAETWHYLSIKLTVNEDDSVDVEIYDGDISEDNKVLSGEDLSFNGNGNIDALGFLGLSYSEYNGGEDSTTRAIRDIVICDTSGSVNNDLLGQVFVSAQEVRAEESGGGWVAHHRQNIGEGILDHTTNQTGLRCADNASLEIGADDFTLESFVRFHELPDDPNLSMLFSKWRAEAGLRSYRLYYDGTDNSLVWEISTDGADNVEVKRVPWTPLTDHWYHVAVSRSFGQTMFFIDGVQLGVPVTDVNTYYDGTAYFGVGVSFTDAGAPDEDNRFNGWLDETRVTIGTARYTSDFTPTTVRFGRDVSEDPNFADVVLLLGYDDETITDESGFARTVSLGSPAVTTTFPEDGDASFEVLNQRPAWDDTYIEAPYLFASGIFTFEDVPTAGETMTVGSTTYTWVESFDSVETDQVIIGSDIAECISNIIAAINAGDGEGVVYGTGTVANTDAQAEEFLSPQFILTAKTIGTDGNSVATTDTMEDGFFAAATLEGGQNIPADSSFNIERLPADATGVLGVQITSRSYKTDAGTAKVRFDLVGPGGAVAAGDELQPDLNPGWLRQIFETDPDTSASLTPSTLNGGKLKFKRTT